MQRRAILTSMHPRTLAASTGVLRSGAASRVLQRPYTDNQALVEELLKEEAKKTAQKEPKLAEKETGEEASYGPKVIENWKVMHAPATAGQARMHPGVIQTEEQEKDPKMHDLPIW